MAVTQKQIAQKLGLSQPLVAQALAENPRVSLDTRRLVQAVANEMGYSKHSNIEARSLASKRHGVQTQTSSISVLLDSFFEGVPLYEVPFFKPLFKGMEMETRVRDLDFSYSIARADRLPHSVTENRIDGLIALYSRPTNALVRERRLSGGLRIPVLQVGDCAPGEWCLKPDDFRGIHLATSHLIELGHTRIAYLGDIQVNSPDVSYFERLEGFKAAFTDRGMQPVEELIEFGLSKVKYAPGLSGGTWLTEQLLSRTRDFTGLVAFNDAIAFAAIQTLEKAGLRVPEDVSVIGFDNIESETTAPRLTTVGFDRLRMGIKAVEMLIDAGKNGTENAESYLMPVELIERETVIPRD